MCFWYGLFVRFVGRLLWFCGWFVAVTSLDILGEEQIPFWSDRNEKSGFSRRRNCNSLCHSGWGSVVLVGTARSTSDVSKRF